jgi:hypothetical protein
LVLILEALGAELEQAVDRRKAFLERPVTTPAGIELDTELTEAVSNLTETKSPFGLKGLFGRTAQKKQLDSIRVLGNPPSNAENWKYVAEHLALLKCLRELALRWNALAPELQLEAVPADKPEGGLAAAQGYALYLKVKGIVKAEGELCAAASLVFPNWLMSANWRITRSDSLSWRGACGTTSPRTDSPTSGLTRSAFRTYWKVARAAS